MRLKQIRDKWFGSIIATSMVVLFAISIVLLCQNFRLKRQIAGQPQDVIAKMKDIQRDIGCEKIDGKPGTETLTKYKLAYELAQKKVFNEYAAVFMTASGKPKGGEQWSK